MAKTSKTTATTDRRLVPYTDTYYSKYNVRHSPAWRFEQASSLSKPTAKPRRSKLDPQVRRLRNYLIRKDAIAKRLGDDELLNEELATRWGPIWLAENIYLGGGGEEDRVRYTTEAMILAGMSDEEIARQAHTDPQAIRIYEQCFFNVRERLKSRRYISNIVLTPVFMSGLGNRTPEVVCKYFGYFGGPEILAVIMDGIEADPTIPTETFQVSRWLDEQFRLRFRTVAMVGSTFMEPTSFSIRTLLEGFTNLLSLAHREQAEVGDDNVLSQAIEMFARKHSAPLGDEAAEVSTLPVPAYANGVVEPRVAELQLLANGEEPEFLSQVAAGKFTNPFQRKKTSAKHESADAAGNGETDNGGS